MLYPLLRPLLFSLKAETAHNLAIRSTALFSRMPPLTKFLHHFTRTHHPFTFAGLTFPNRVGLAGGMDKNGVAPAAWWACGFGFVELGTVTPRPQNGNDQPRMWRDVPRRALFNRMGFNNDGADVVAARLAMLKFRPPFPIGISIGKNKDTPNERAEDDYAEAGEKLAPHADFVTINVSSPNTVGLRALQTAEAMAKLVSAVRTVIGGKPLLVKFAPELTGDELKAVLDACLTAGAVGVIATNTKAATSPTGLPCGESGRPIQDLSRQRVEEIRKHVGGGVLLIGVGGIEDEKSAARMVDAGADLIQVYSALVYEGPFLPARLARGLKRRAVNTSPDRR
ncbi:quinone-dependent dihydroorotate dehydrogenase [Limnoglobus roseus]|uniref:Dihydroorotate dehydrogenase (quinone) n=1 Tax=Limnoglobus roseus TaxID=2598579 RepID=A0A5C1AI56_9BACT|nr:quinone-dependent dihydroorotate dehydrogenase [Limnoglobus roseus]QEL19109.1 quinone-dependent dihydroorotate dehydrogenase [Limnoglobus roseus]